jgi:hypothetical protein
MPSSEHKEKVIYKRDHMENEERLNSLKKHIFYELLDVAGRVMVLVRHSADVVIGNRGFVGEERESGVVLVFNPKMKFTWDEFGISATLVFGAAPQKCFIPASSIAAVYSPELNIQFVAGGSERAAAAEPVRDEGKSRGHIAGRKDGSDAADTPDKNVINVDFVHKQKLKRSENE